MKTLPRYFRSARGLATALLLLPACHGSTGVLGDVTATEGTTSNGADDTETEGECTEDCDPDFAVATISGINFRERGIHRYGSATCEGPACPETVQPVALPTGEMPEACLESPEALESVFGAAEYCRVAASRMGAFQIEFQTPPDRQSFEETRPRADEPTLEEGYRWHHDVVQIEGPGTALSADYRSTSVVGYEQATSVVNEACAERLTAQGVSFTEDELETLCVGTWDDGGTLRPLRMRPSMVFRPREGMLSTSHGSSCNTNESGPDLCCSACDFVLGTQVARYGVDGAGVARSPNNGTAIACDPLADPLLACRDLELSVDRSDEELTYRYAWDGAEQEWSVPWYDKIRETHPDDRPAAVEVRGQACGSANDCGEGQECIGTDAEGQACSFAQDCFDRTCRAQWFGACEEVTAGAGAFCHDRRFSDRSAACFVNDAGERLSECDPQGIGILDPEQCCDPALGGGPGCDPFLQSGLSTVDRYDRNEDLSAEASCVCAEGQPADCAETIDTWCEMPVGSAEPELASPAGDYAMPMVARVGGTRGDLGGLTLRMATIGQVPRALVEECAEGSGRIGKRSAEDGWILNEMFVPDLFEDHDLAFCSGSTYRMTFADSSREHHVRSEAGGNLDGRSEHILETSQFRVVPYSFLPTDNLTIASCVEMYFSVSARYDPSLDNLNKIEIREGSADGPVVVGGQGCNPSATEEEVQDGVIPCAVIDVSQMHTGYLRVVTDDERHGHLLEPGQTYTVVLPGLQSIDQMSDPELYAAAFHDSCGMPLIVGETEEQRDLSRFSFTVDEPCEW